MIGLSDPDLDEVLARDGYVHLGPLLPPGEVDAARRAFDDALVLLDQPLGDEWFPTILLQQADARDLITSRLGELIIPRLHGVLINDALRIMRLDYSVKPASAASGLGPHQDYSVVDETRATSLYLWIPLCPTDADNGTLHVVPGSHRFANRIRSRHVPAVFDEVLDEVREAAVPLDCRAGDLVVMVSGVVHFSPPNLADDLRLAAHCIVTPRDVPLVFYFADEQTPADLVECYEVDLDTYVRHIHAGRPDPNIPMSGHVARPPGSMTRERFVRGLADLGEPHSGTHPRTR